MAFQAIHIPVQAPREFTDRYQGVYSDGWQATLNFGMDLTPTMAELAGIQSLNGFDGRSLMPIPTGSAEAVYPPEVPVGLEVAGNSALFKGRHKLTRNSLPHGDGQWRLHDLRLDPAESEDLSAQQPQLRAELLADYQRYAKELSVIALPADFDVQAQVNSNVQPKLIDNSLSNPAIVAGLFAMFLVVLGRGFLGMRALRRR